MKMIENLDRTFRRGAALFLQEHSLETIIKRRWTRRKSHVQGKTLDAGQVQGGMERQRRQRSGQLIHKGQTVATFPAHVTDSPQPK